MKSLGADSLEDTQSRGTSGIQSTQGHMPGPWKAVAVQTSDPSYVYAISRGGNGWWLALVTRGQDKLPGEGLANAHLMAAAPIMFEALIASRKWMGERPINPTSPQEISAAMIIDAQDLAIAEGQGSFSPDGSTSNDGHGTPPLSASGESALNSGGTTTRYISPHFQGDVSGGNKRR